MKSLKYFIEYIFVKLFYIIFRLIGFELSSFITGKIFKIYGYFSKRTLIAISNFEQAIQNKTNKEIQKIVSKMWENFGRVIGEYPNLDKISVKNNSKIRIININNLLLPLKNYKNCLFFCTPWELGTYIPCFNRKWL